MTTPRACIVLVGGHGTRMHPLTTTRPKHLLPVGGIPLIDLVIGRLVDHGVRDIALAVSVHADLIGAHVAGRPGSLGAEGVRCVLSHEDEPLGTGGAIVTAAHLLDLDPDDALLVVNGDLLTGHDLRAQASLLDGPAEVVLHVRPVADPRPFGTVRCDDEGWVVGFDEKVAGPPGTLVNAGTYALRAGLLLDEEAGRASSWEHDLLPTIIRRGAPVRAYHEPSWFTDVGTPAALLDASRSATLGEAAGALPHDHDPGRAVAADADIHPSATVGDGTSVGSGSVVGADARIEGSVLMDNVVVEEGATVSRSVIGEGAVVGAGAVLDGSAVGDGAVIVPGRRLEPGSTVEAGA